MTAQVIADGYYRLRNLNKNDVYYLCSAKTTWQDGKQYVTTFNPDSKGNIRDGASINELICLSNMENVFDKRVQSQACLRFAERRKRRTKFNINAVLINDGLPQGERLVKLNKIAIQQMRVLTDDEGRKLLK